MGDRLESWGLLRDVDVEKRQVVAVISTGDIARDDAIIDPKGWVFDNYDRNPVVLWAHDDRAVPPARTLEKFATDTELIAKAQFDDDPAADLLFGKIQRGFVNATSVRWYPLASEFREVEVGQGKDAKKKQVLVFTKQELLEWSFVSIPADPKALILRAGTDEAILPGEFEGEEYDEERPFPNEHACRLRDPGEFKPGSFRRVGRDHEGKRYFVIMGRLKGKTSMSEQAYRYPKASWSPGAARAHCKAHDGKLFEPASSAYSDGSEWERCNLGPENMLAEIDYMTAIFAGLDAEAWGRLDGPVTISATQLRTHLERLMGRPAAPKDDTLKRLEGRIAALLEARETRPSVEDIVVRTFAKVTGRTEESVRRQLAQGG